MGTTGFVSVKEAARLMGISRQRTQELISTGKLPATKLSGSVYWLVRESDVLTRIRQLKRRSS